MPKRIVIGVGGTGLEVLRSIRRRIVEAHPREGLGHYPSVGFLYIDTDDQMVKKTEDSKKRWEVLNTSVALQEREIAIIQAPRSVGAILENIGAYPQIGSWLPAEKLKLTLDVAAKDSPGAQQIRPLGRAIFTLNADKVKTKFASLLGSLENQQGETQVYLACSLSGGTGGGMFLDLGYSIREWLGERGLLTAFLVLPDPNEEADRGERYVPNAYASLLDLNYFSVRSVPHRGVSMPVGFQLPGSRDPIRTNPFELTYLMGIRNQAGVQVTLDSLPDMIAHRIHLEFDEGIAAGVAGLRNNAATERALSLKDPFNGNPHAQSFLSFGLSTIQYPTEQITEIIAYRLVKALFDGWKMERPVDNMAERVAAIQAELLLDNEHLLGNKDYFGQSQDFPAISAQVKADVEQEISSLPKDNKATILRRGHTDYINQFRGGVTRFYRGRLDNLEGAANVVARRVREQVCRAITHPEMGIPTAIAEVDELARVLTVKRQQFVDYANGLAPKAKATGVSLDAAFGQLTQAENAMTFRERRINEALQRLSVIMGSNRINQIEQPAYDLGQKLLGRIIMHLGELRQQLVEAQTAITLATDTINREVEGLARFLDDRKKGTHKFNGTVLFDAEKVEQVFEAIDREQAVVFIAESLLGAGRSQDVLAVFESVSSGGGGKERAGADEVDQAFRAAVDWLGNHNVLASTRKNVADQLVESYPDRAARVDQIAAAIKKAMPFAEFDSKEMTAYYDTPGAGYKADGTKTAFLTGIMGDKNKTLPNVTEVRRNVVAAAGRLRDDDQISDTAQIIFIGETAAFPLRLLSDVALMRKKYLAYTSGPLALPLLLQKSYSPPIGDLYLASDREKENFEIAQEAFLAGWSEGWLVVQEDVKEKRPEVRYVYVESGVSCYDSLGTDWPEAFDYWMSEDSRAGISRQRAANTLIRAIEGMETQRERLGFLARLYALLEALKDSYENREQDERYKRWNQIRLRLVERFKLLRAGESVPKLGFILISPSPQRQEAAAVMVPVKDPASTSGEATYRRYVEVAHKSSPKGLSQAMEAMLKVQQTRSGVSDAEARRIVNSVFGPAESEALSHYRGMLQALLQNGPLTDDAMVLLTEMRVEENLDDADVERVEREIRAEMQLRA